MANRNNPPRAGRRRSLTVVLLVGVAGSGLVAANTILASHAWRMTHFAAAGAKTPPPEELGAVARIEVALRGVVLPRPQNKEGDAPLGVRAETHKADGIASRVFPGAGRGVALLYHGYGGSRSDMTTRALTLHDRGWTTVLVDFPGAGESDGDTTTLGWQEAQVVADTDMYQTSHPLILVGASMGSAAVLRAVGDLGLRVDALVLENPYDRLVTTVGHRFEAMGVPARPGAWLLVFWGGVELGFNGFEMNPVVSAARVTAPTLLLHGALDSRVHVDEVEAIRDALAGPKELVLFPEAGHVGLIAADEARWVAAVLPFLDRWAPGVVHEPPTAAVGLAPEPSPPVATPP